MSERPPPPPDRHAESARFRATLVRVMLVQLATLALLWLVQTRYSV